MIPRHITPSLAIAAGRYPVVYLTGPRQSGKTTLAMAAFPEHPYVSLEDPDEREFAALDPRGFLRRFSDGAIFDEIQRAPELLSYLEGEVDRDARPGRFIITGSQQLLLRHHVSQTLAGRVALLQLLPFSLAELEGREPADPAALADATNFPAPPACSLETMLFEGLYPRIHDQRLDARDWLANYYRAYVERDVRQVLKIGDLETFQRFVRLCAGRSGQLLNLSSLGSDCGISHSTARQWLSVLEASFLVMLLRPHHANFSKRLVKSPKLYFLDTGLLCYLLRVTRPEDLETHPAKGAILETFVVSEFVKTFLNRAEDPPLHFWRDRTGHEVDLLVDLPGGTIPVEVKAGRTVASDAFAGLRYWLALADVPGGHGVLVYGGDGGYEREGIAVRPWYALG
ncbi:MAG: ATP-binding protein [Coriobacteriia bacterium]